MRLHSEYTAGNLTHQEYYGQFITPAVRNRVFHTIGIEKIKNSKDKHFNDIPLSKWDNLAQYSEFQSLREKFTEAGDFMSLSSVVCVAKQAAHMLKAENCK